jgi:hypothetical protein
VAFECPLISGPNCPTVADYIHQTIWDTMERHFGLEITKPLLFSITIKTIYIKNLIFFYRNHKIRVSV